MGPTPSCCLDHGTLRARVRAAARSLVDVLVGVSLVAAGCGGPVGTPAASAMVATTPAGPPILGLDWGRAATAGERPLEAFAEATPDPSVLQSQLPGRAGHPEHFPGQAVMSDVVRTAGGLVAIGYVYPGWLTIAWSSPDGETWSLHDLPGPDFTFPVAMAVGADGTIVAVGRSGDHPASWRSKDGAEWTAVTVPTRGPGGAAAAERMTAIVATSDGYLAGGSVGPELGARRARFWHSSDGWSWTPVPDEAAAFADAEVRSIVRFGSGFVAVGFLGTGEMPTGSVAWTSPDGVRWRRIDAPDLRTGRAVALTVASSGGLVAVGSDLDIHEALVWTSADGSAWTRAPGEPSRQYSGKIRMNDVTVVGDNNGLQYANMAAWSSRDGIHWARATDVAVFGQGEPYAVAAAPIRLPDGTSTTGVVAVGSFGNPDDYIPTVWLTPAR